MAGTIPGVRARLAAVAEAIPENSRVADIGSDHGRLPRLLVHSGRARSCIATEHGAGPAHRLKSGVVGSAEADRIEIRRGNGLEPLHPEDRLQVLVLSGMGGATMLEILQPPRLEALGVERLVLQPQSSWGRLRRALDERGWTVERERLVRDRDRFYTVMSARRGAEAAPLPPGFEAPQAYEVGPCWYRDREPLALEYWAGRERHAKTLLRSARGAGRDHAESELRLARGALAAFERAPVG